MLYHDELYKLLLDLNPTNLCQLFDYDLGILVTIFNNGSLAVNHRYLGVNHLHNPIKSNNGAVLFRRSQYGAKYETKGSSITLYRSRRSTSPFSSTIRMRGKNKMRRLRLKGIYRMYDVVTSVNRIEDDRSTTRERRFIRLSMAKLIRMARRTINLTNAYTLAPTTTTSRRLAAVLSDNIILRRRIMSNLKYRVKRRNNRSMIMLLVERRSIIKSNVNIVLTKDPRDTRRIIRILRSLLQNLVLPLNEKKIHAVTNDDNLNSVKIIRRTNNTMILRTNMSINVRILIMNRTSTILRRLVGTTTSRIKTLRIRRIRTRDHTRRIHLMYTLNGINLGSKHTINATYARDAKTKTTNSTMNRIRNNSMIRPTTTNLSKSVTNVNSTNRKLTSRQIALFRLANRRYATKDGTYHIRNGEESKQYGTTRLQNGRANVGNTSVLRVYRVLVLLLRILTNRGSRLNRTIYIYHTTPLTANRLCNINTNTIYLNLGTTRSDVKRQDILSSTRMRYTTTLQNTLLTRRISTTTLRRTTDVTNNMYTNILINMERNETRLTTYRTHGPIYNGTKTLRRSGNAIYVVRRDRTRKRKLFFTRETDSGSRIKLTYMKANGTILRLHTSSLQIRLEGYRAVGPPCTYTN